MLSLKVFKYISMENFVCDIFILESESHNLDLMHSFGMDLYSHFN